MKKIIIRRSKMQLKCGQAKPGANLSFLKNMMNFCRDFNEKTNKKNGDIVNVEIKVYRDFSYSFEIKSTPTSLLIKDIILTNNKENEDDDINDIKIDEIISKITSESNHIFNTKNKEKIKKIIKGTIKSFNKK